MVEINKIVGEHEEVALPQQHLLEIERLLEDSWNNRPNSGKKAARNDIPDRQRFVQISRYPYPSIKTNQHVGIIQTSKVKLTILPKIFSAISDKSPAEKLNRASKDLLYFLSFTRKTTLPRLSLSNFEGMSSPDLLEVFIGIFASYTLHTFERSFYRSYEEEVENLRYIKGRIDFSEHFKKNLFRQRKDRIVCKYESFKEDVLFNRIVKQVALYLLKYSSSDENKKLLNGILNILSDVSLGTYSTRDCDKVKFGKFQKEFSPILDYCRVFIGRKSINFKDSNIEIFAFLINMNDLFEEFISNFLLNKMQGWNDIKFTSQKQDVLTCEGKFKMYYDIFLEKDGKPIALIDVKYKKSDFYYPDGPNGLQHADLYQMVSYAVKSGCDSILLLYPRYVGQDSNGFTMFTVEDACSKRRINIYAAYLDLTELPDAKLEKDFVVSSQLQEIFYKMGIA